MKTFITIPLLFISTLLAAQSPTEIPKSEFKVSLPENSVTIKPGESKEVAMTITRSKSYSKLSAEPGTFSPLPNGIVISFDPKEGNFESTHASISVASGVPSGTYSIVMGAIINSRKKGSVLEIKVD
ncbi:MAG: hypothetical protein JNL53_02440 [Cyclobacteriaceae bacterium]|nr:hypothetical protein [Cyclobacteriaceae bacterium]